MSLEETSDRSLKFHGARDLAAHHQAPQAAAILERLDPSRTDYTLDQIIELHNARLFVEAGIVPRSYSAEQQETLSERVSTARRTIGRFFSTLDDAKLAAVAGPLLYDYHSDLLELFARNKIYTRCTPAAVLALLDRLDVGLSDMLASSELVSFCNAELRLRLLSNHMNAELLIRKYLQRQPHAVVYMPATFTPRDAASLVDEYLGSDDANLNYLQLVSPARPTVELGLDARTKLKAKRQYARRSSDYFADNQGFRTSCEVLISDEQVEPVESSSADGDTRFSYSLRWLEENLDYGTVLNNCINLFDFADVRCMLTLPSFAFEMSALEGAVRVFGANSYATGTCFSFKEQLSSLQLLMYSHFLAEHEIGLESALEWFFRASALENFGIEGYQFRPSSSAATYLERCRHLFSEMESVVKQYKLYVEDSEIDGELLGILSEGVHYKSIPSLLQNKYVYSADRQDITAVLQLLFSDQAGLGYINEDLKAETAAALLARRAPAYGDFRDYQRRDIDFLIRQGVLVDTGSRIAFADSKQVRVLKDLFDHEAANYHHYSPDTRRIVDDMLRAGWLRSESTLLSAAEAKYFNYYLNQTDFSNGPDLRNKYLHGSHDDASDEDEHFRTYIVVLKLLIALTIKINDDLCLRADGAELEPRI